jgi:hypothetical protein
MEKPPLTTFVKMVVTTTRVVVIMTHTTAQVMDQEALSVNGSQQLTGKLLEFGLSLSGVTLAFLLLGHGFSHHLLSASI